MSNDNDYITTVATLSNQVTYLIQDILEVPCWTRVCVDTTYQHIIISIQTTVNRLQLRNNLQERPSSKVDSDSYTQWSCTLPKNWSLYNGTRFTSYTCSCVIHRVNIYWSHSLAPPSYSSLAVWCKAGYGLGIRLDTYRCVHWMSMVPFVYLEENVIALKSQTFNCLWKNFQKFYCNKIFKNHYWRKFIPSKT